MVEYLLANMWQLWAVVSIICLILELTLGDLFLSSFAFGAIITVIVAVLGGGIYIQLIVFIAFSLFTIFLIRPALLKKLHGDNERISNADAIIGRIGTVSDTIEIGGFGRVDLDGDNWKAVSSTGLEIIKGSKVKIIGRDSIIITVETIPIS